MLSPRYVDLNADLGESGHVTSPDAVLMMAITSANVACGFHAGTPATMRATVALARDHCIDVGAHPSFADRDGFGRREVATSALEIENLVAYQIGALAGVASSEGVRLGHVKPHGALYNMAARDRTLADAIVRAVAAVDRSLVLFALSGSQLVTAGRDAGLRTANEVFADRAYRGDGSLVPRGTEGAVIHDANVAAARAVAMITDGSVATIDGTRIALEADTICVHGDTPGAASMALQIRRALEHAGMIVRAIGPR